MSDDPETTPAEEPATKPARKKTTRKAAKPRVEPEAKVNSPPVDLPAESDPTGSPGSDFEQGSPAGEDPRDTAPEPIPFFSDSSVAEPPGNTKKRRRRKKKHGQSQPGPHPHAVAPPAEGQPELPEQAPPPAMHPATRAKLDPEEVAKKAWKMFQAEVGEEGLALIDDHDAREISRRCFRLAEIFLDEAARRTR